MPHKLDWYIEGQVVYAKLWGEQTLEELKESNANITKYLDGADKDNPLIHIIMDDANLGKLPISLVQVQKVLTYTKHPNLGWVTMIGNKDKKIKDVAQEFIIVMLAKITGARYIRLKTLEDAIIHLKAVDQRIKWSEVDKRVQAEISS